MEPEQREPRQVVIEEDSIGPAALVVALSALPSLLSLVDVVGPVAADAGAVEPLFVERSLVAPLAPDAPVRPPQREVRRSIVVEGRGLPARLVVAITASGAIAPAVLVVRAVAGNAIRSRLSVSRSLAAWQASQLVSRWPPFSGNFVSRS